MDIATAYEVDLVDRDSGLALHCLAVPADAIPFEFNPDAWLDELGVEPLERLPVASDLSAAVASLLQQPEDAGEAAALYRELHDRDRGPEVFERIRPTIEFAEYASYVALVPLRESPLDLHSLGSLMAGGSFVGGGAVLGAAVGAGVASPLLFLTVPAGVIIVGVAAAFTEGLRYHVRRLMRVPDEPVLQTEAKRTH